MNDMNKLSRLAGVLRGVTIAAMVALCIAITISLLTTPLSPEIFADDMPVAPDTGRVQLAIVAALNLLNPLILLWTLNRMRALFGAYARGEVLTDHCAALIQRIGQGFVALAILPLLLRPVQTVLLTMANPPGTRSISIGLDNDTVFFALSGGLIILIGWAMREAASAAAENRSFV